MEVDRHLFEKGTWSSKGLYHPLPCDVFVRVYYSIGDTRGFLPVLILEVLSSSLRKTLEHLCHPIDTIHGSGLGSESRCVPGPSKPPLGPAPAGGRAAGSGLTGRVPWIGRQEKMWQCKADILRLEFLWHHGGLYVDADMISVEQLREPRAGCERGWGSGGWAAGRLLGGREPRNRALTVFARRERERERSGCTFPMLSHCKWEPKGSTSFHPTGHPFSCLFVHLSSS